MSKYESSNAHYEETNRAMHDVLAKYFFVADKERDLETILKITSQIGYLQQVHTGLSKNLLVENQIKDIYKKLNRIPPEILEQYVTNPELILPVQ